MKRNKNNKMENINTLENKKINLYIGLVTKDLIKLKKDRVLRFISNEFIKNGISGFNVNSIIGFWDNKQEKSLIISFFNTFNLNLEVLKVIINKFKEEFKQDAILLEVLNSPFEFI
jgi:hypothetical protein